jgi:hypothetical protein
MAPVAFPPSRHTHPLEFAAPQTRSGSILLLVHRLRGLPIVTTPPIAHNKTANISLRPATERPWVSGISCAAHSHAGQSMCDAAPLLPSLRGTHRRAEIPDVLFKRFWLRGSGEVNSFELPSSNCFSSNPTRPAEDLGHAKLTTQSHRTVTNLTNQCSCSTWE